MSLFYVLVWLLEVLQAVQGSMALALLMAVFAVPWLGRRFWPALGIHLLAISCHFLVFVAVTAMSFLPSMEAMLKGNFTSHPLYLAAGGIAQFLVYLCFYLTRARTDNSQQDG